MAQIEVRKLYASLISYLRLTPCDWTYPGRHCTVLNYHYFCPGIPSSYLEVSTASLAVQLKVLRSNFAIVTLKEAARITGSHQLLSTAKPVIAISVDDGCKSFDSALPTFERFEVPLTLFVPIGLCLGEDSVDGLRSWCLHYSGFVEPTEFIPSCQNQDDIFGAVLSAGERQLRTWLIRLQATHKRSDPICARRLLNFAQLRELARHPLITVASHSMSHQSLAALPEAWCRWEIESSLGYVRECGGDPELFAYPYGHQGAFNEATTVLLSSAGVRYAWTTLASRVSGSSRPLSLGRAAMFDGTGFHYIRGTAAGAFEPWDRIRFGIWSTDSP